MRNTAVGTYNILGSRSPNASTQTLKLQELIYCDILILHSQYKMFVR